MGTTLGISRSLALLLLLLPAIAVAQEGRFHPTMGGGPTSLDGTLGEGFGTGWGPVLGVSVEVNEWVGFNVEYSFRSFMLRSDLDETVTKYDARHKMNELAVSMVGYLTRHESRVRPYVIGGPGLYHRKVEIAHYVGDGVICNPYLYVCGTYPPDQIAASRGGWDVGLNGGIGVGVRLAESAELFIEARYHYVWGPEIEPGIGPQPTAAGPRTVNGQYLPITIGVKF